MNVTAIFIAIFVFGLLILFPFTIVKYKGAGQEYIWAHFARRRARWAALILFFPVVVFGRWLETRMAWKR